MKSTSITFKFLALIVIAFFITTVSVVILADHQLTQIIDRSQTEIYLEKLDTILGMLTRKHQQFQDTLMNETYKKEFQASVLTVLYEDYYSSKGQGIYPFIVDKQGKVLIHPTLKQGSEALVDLSFMKIMLTLKQGDFNYRYEGQATWTIFKHFKGWDWVVGYAMPLKEKYADARKFRNILILIMVVITGIVLIIVSVIITRFTQQIVRLTQVSAEMAAGNLDREIEIHGKNEIGILAQSFANMRDAIREKIIALNKEIEERKQAQEAATKERHLLFALMDNTPDHIYFKDTRSRFTRLNKAMATWLGLHDPLQAVGKTDFNFFTKEHARQAYIDEQRVIKTGQPLVNVEEKETWPDNRQTWVSSTKIPLYDEGGSIVGTIGISRNITEQKHTQEALQKLNEELDQRVAERTAELQKLLETLRKTQAQLIQSEKMAALGELVSGIAHEINTPVGIGVTAASYLDSETHQMKALYESDTLKQSDFNHYIKTATESTSMILKNLQRAAHLIQHFKQVSVDQITERRRVFNLKDYIEGVLLSLQPALRKKQHNITVHCPKELKLKSYPGAFSQIITNFVMNSLSHGFEHIKKGEILITVIVMHGNMLHFEYSDNGCGIAPKNLSKIFDPFFTTKRARGGTGLGMNVVYNLVTQRLRGNITCESEENKGTKFIIQVPIEEEE